MLKRFAQVLRCILPTALVALLLSQPQADAAPASTALQVDPAHDGQLTFPTPFAPPLKTHWVVDLGGPISYPVVAGKLVIVTTTGSVGTRLVALDAATGKTVWQKIVSGDSPYITGNANAVYLTTFDGPLQAFRATTGAGLWSIQLPGQSFFNFVPIAADGYVYSAGDGVGTTIYAVNEKSGKLAWQQELDAGGAGATFGDGQVFFSVPCDVAAYNPATGKRGWNYNSGCDGGGGQVASYFAGRVFAPDVNLDGGIVLNAANGKVLSSLSATLPAFYGRSMFSISGNSLASSDILTGNLNWFYTPKGQFSGSPIVVNGNVYTLTQQGQLYVNNGATGKVMQVIMIGVGSQTSGSSGYSGLGGGQGLVFVPSGSRLAAVGP